MDTTEKAATDVSADRDVMIASVLKLEAILAQLEAPFRDYTAALDAVTRAAYGAGRRPNRPFELQSRFGMLPALLVRRLQGLGWTAVLDQARVGGALDAGWAEAFAAKIRADLADPG